MTTTKTEQDLSGKEKALADIAVLAQKHDITLDEIGACLTRRALQNKSGKWVTRLLAYLGAALVFGGLALFMTMIWDDLNSPARVIITYGPGLVAFILGIMVLKDPRFEKASTPLFLKSAVLLPTGMFVFLHEYADGDDTQLAAMIVFGLLAFQFLGAFFTLKRTSLLFFGYLFWNSALGLFMDRLHVPEEFLGIGLGLSIMTTAWCIDRTRHRATAPFWYFMGSSGFLWAVFDLLEGVRLFDICYLPVAITIMMLSTRIHSRTLLLVSTFS
ncbi:MAG: DUF2157 domain-containing protein, partial [Alphaproteobacteria bacterium]|nr:DUF2157 domain-containing protein [Alphaproteobacteria bacterium]